MIDQSIARIEDRLKQNFVHPVIDVTTKWVPEQHAVGFCVRLDARGCPGAKSDAFIITVVMADDKLDDEATIALKLKVARQVETWNLGEAAA